MVSTRTTRSKRAVEETQKEGVPSSKPKKPKTEAQLPETTKSKATIGKPAKPVKPVKPKAPKAPKVEPTEGAESTDPQERHWLLKAEPETRLVDGHDVKFSIDDLKDMKVSPWDGVRNYEARNNMKAMKKGELAFFYHSNCKAPGIVGIMRIVKEAYVDSFDKKHPYYDPKSSPDNPKWFMVDVEYVEHLPRLVGLRELRSYATTDLAETPLVKKSRLSVSPIGPKDWDFILKLANQKPRE